MQLTPAGDLADATIDIAIHFLLADVYRDEGGDSCFRKVHVVSFAFPYDPSFAL